MYTVVAAETQEKLNDGADVEFEFDTISEAKRRAKYYLSDDYQRATESLRPLGYSQVRDETGRCLFDFFRK